MNNTSGPKIEKDEKEEKEEKEGPREALKNEKEEKGKKYYVYVLESENNSKRTYVGYTNNLQRRIRQHNGDLKSGGARYTKYNRPWKYVCHISGSPEWFNETRALQLEWCLHKIRTVKRRHNKWMKIKNGKKG